MTDTDFIKLGVGDPFPSNFYADVHLLNGALPELLTGHNTLLISIPSPSYTEKKLFKKGKLTAGVIYKDDLLYLLWQFEDHKKRRVQFDGRFDVRLISKDKLDLPSMTSKNERLLLNVIAVDADTRCVAAIRVVTCHPVWQQRFFDAVHEQLATPARPEAAEAYQRHLESLTYEGLFRTTTLHEFGV